MKVDSAAQKAPEPGRHDSGSARLIVYVLAVYVVAWHVMFLALMGNAVDLDLYRSYLRFIILPGFEMPSFIQLGAVLLTATYFVIRWAARRARRHA